MPNSNPIHLFTTFSFTLFLPRIYRLLAALLLLSFAPARAQTPDSLRQALDHLFASLDKTQVPADNCHGASTCPYEPLITKL